MILHESRQEAESKTRNYAKQTGQSSHAMRDQAQQDGAPSQARPHTSSGKCQTKLNERAKRAKHDRKTKQSKIRRRCNEDKKPSQTRRPTKLSSPIGKLGEAGEEPNQARMETRPNQTRQPKQGARKPRNVKQQTKPSKTWNQSKVGHRVSKDLGRALGYDRGGWFWVCLAGGHSGGCYVRAAQPTLMRCMPRGQVRLALATASHFEAWAHRSG